MYADKPNESQLKKLRKLELLARNLDEGMSAGEIDTSILKDTQNYLNNIRTDFTQISTPVSWTYIFYETEGLVRWIEGREREAYKSISAAMVTKGDTDLLTKNGRKLLSSVSEPLVTSNVKTPMSMKTKLFYASFLIILLPITLLLLALDGKYSGTDKLKAIGWTVPILAFLSIFIVIISSLASTA